MKIFKTGSVLFALLLSAKIFGQNQQLSLSQKIYNKENKIIFAKIDSKEDFPSSVSNDKFLLQRLTSHSENVTYRLKRTYKGSLDYTHKVYKAYYKNIEVTGGLDYVIHVKNGSIIMVNGDFSDIDYVNERPLLTVADAISKALAWSRNAKTLTRKPEAESVLFVICKDLLLDKSKYRAAYKIMVKTDNPADDAYYFVDALSGNIIRINPLVCTGNSPGTAQTRYSGTKGFTTDFTGSQYRLRQVRNGVNIITLNNNNSYDESGGSATDFWDNNNFWAASEHGVDQPATDAHWGAEKVFDYWLTKHNRNSIDNAGMDIVSYVHFGNSYDNAFWHISRLAMYYGDGGSYFRPLTALDVCTHEIGHGICQFTSNLEIGNTQAGALNEGFSDIWAACIEAWAAPNKQRWKIGEEIMLNPSLSCLRNLLNPNDIFSGDGPCPDTYEGQFWATDGEPHINSTVLSHWFYLLTEGGSGTNDFGNNFTVAGIGIDNAAKIAYLTEELLDPNANYGSVRAVSIDAATQLFGSGSCETIAVTKAWYAVGVGDNYTGPIPQLSITGPDVLCFQETYSIGLPPGASVTWSSGGSWFNVAPNGSSAIVTRIGPSGQAYLGATVSGLTGCYAQSNPNVQKLLRIGEPTWYTLIPYYSTTGYSYYLQEINCLKTYTFPGMYSGDISLEDQAATSFNWTFVSKYPSTAIAGISYSDPRYATVTVKPEFAWAIYRLTTSNICGSYSHDYKFTANGGCVQDPQRVQTSKGIPTLTILPNPVTSNFTVALNTGKKGAVIREVVIQNKIGLIMKRVQFNNQSDKQFVDISLLPTDVYIVKVFDGTEWISGKIVKQ